MKTGSYIFLFLYLQFSIVNLYQTGNEQYLDIEENVRKPKFQHDIKDTIYPPNWEALDKRPLPLWYDAAKVGIFVVWGVYSVPSVYSEWFWYRWKGEKVQKYVDFMKRNYRPDFTYADFAPLLTAEFLDTNEWVKLFKYSGAQ